MYMYNNFIQATVPPFSVGKMIVLADISVFHHVQLNKQSE